MGFKACMGKKRTIRVLLTSMSNLVVIISFPKRDRYRTETSVLSDIDKLVNSYRLQYRNCQNYGWIPICSALLPSKMQMVCSQQPIPQSVMDLCLLLYLWFRCFEMSARKCDNLTHNCLLSPGDRVNREVVIFIYSYF